MSTPPSDLGFTKRTLLSLRSRNLVPAVWIAIVVAAMVGAASVAYMTATTALAQIRTEPQMIGRVLAIQSVLIVGTTPIGGPILGAIADGAGGRAPVVIGGAAALAAAVFAFVAARRAGVWRTRLDPARAENQPVVTDAAELG